MINETIQKRQEAERKLVMDQLRKIPIVQLACERSGVSRSTYYRWRREDAKFKKATDEAMQDGEEMINDLSESQLITLIKEKNYPAISFWLRHRNDNYKNKLEITTKEESEALTPSQQKIVRNALKLAAITKSKSIKRINKEK